MSAPESPIERVNYFNGQRLEASDFRADQDYHMRVRRKVLSALYSPGIIQGFEVTPHPTDQHKVVVAPGVGLDYWGRELILLDTTDVQAAGTPTTTAGVIFGNYLLASYAEQRVQADNDGCAVGGAAGTCNGNLSWGAPTRIEATPKLEFSDTWPSPTSGKIVLAQVGLQAGCQVGSIQTGVRQYAVTPKNPTVRAISLEGEKDIDANNPKVLYFHLDGGTPNSMTLYLYASLFSTLFYTELGAHTHADTFTISSIPGHTHTLGAVTTDKQLPTGTIHASAKTFQGAGGDYSLRLWQPDQGTTDLTASPANFTLSNTEHLHNIAAGASTDLAGAITPTITPTLASAGVSAPSARTGGATPLTYVNGLKVLYDGANDITNQILAQLMAADPVNWPAGSTLGNGSSTHRLVTNGTGAIDLIQAGADVTPGQHSLTFEVPSGNGGQVQYNLYVA
jgi:hypothetical protein